MFGALDDLDAQAPRANHPVRFLVDQNKLTNAHATSTGSLEFALTLTGQALDLTLLAVLTAELPLAVANGAIFLEPRVDGAHHVTVRWAAGIARSHAVNTESPGEEVLRFSCRDRGVNRSCEG